MSGVSSGYIAPLVWTPDAIAAHGMAALRHAFIPLDTPTGMFA